jgi:phosphatidylglycerophosphatase A
MARQNTTTTSRSTKVRDRKFKRAVTHVAAETPTQLVSYLAPVLECRLPAFSWYEFIATGFFSGYLPKAPGTWGTLFAALLFTITAKLLAGAGLWQVGAFTVSWYALSLGIATTAIGIYASELLARQWREKDPGEIVIDEFAGMFFALALVTPNFVGVTAAFAFFRLFDIFKPGPTRALQSLPGGFGIVLDDVLAGLAAAPAAYAVQYMIEKFL